MKIQAEILSPSQTALIAAEAQNEVARPSDDSLNANSYDAKTIYRYHGLSTINEFRILVIPAGSFSDPLHGEVITAKFSEIDSLEYEALSYTWADETGDSERMSEFLCDEDGSIIRITKNCEAAIRRVRYPDKDRWVWIDAICINQSSVPERTYQVSMMSKIYTAARNVIVYTGESTANTDLLFDWLNGLKTEDLEILLKWDLDNLAADAIISLEKYLSIARERLFSLFGAANETRILLSQEQLVALAKEFFSRRWFQRVWVLQEVSLPSPRHITVLCGSKSTSAIRALHALSLLYQDSSTTMIRIFVLMRKKIKVQNSYLLDILIETRDREACDARDKIFGILSIVEFLDKGKWKNELGARYGMDVKEAFTWYSSWCIRHYGPGFFLALIKSRQSIEGLPSWAADWAVPWPNCRAVEGRDFPAASRNIEADDGAVMGWEDGRRVLSLRRPRIRKGFFTRNGHLDEVKKKDMRIGGVESLKNDEILIEIYPGLAALLRQEGGFYVFIQVCPHSVSRAGVEELVERWSMVVVDGEGLKDPGGFIYLSEVELFNIH